VPAGQSGPRLIAFAGLRLASFRQSQRRTARFREALLRQPCCPGLVPKMPAQVTPALRPAFEELASSLPSQRHLGIDKSPTREAGAKSWLWTFVAGLFTVFAVRGTRAATVRSELPTGAFTGVVVCDRAKMDRGLGRLPWCWAHLAREFRAPADSEDRVVRRLGHDLRRPTRGRFRQWSRCRDGTISRAELKSSLEPVRGAVEG
jgi:hypothetical protein